MQWNPKAWKNYLHGRATTEELKALHDYFQSDDLEEWIDCVKREKLSEEPIPTDIDQRITSNVLQYIDLPAGKNNEGGRVLKMNGWRWTAVASVLLLVAGYWGWSRRSTIQSGAVAVSWDTVGRSSDAIRLLTLADGTRVWLNRRSELLISQTFATDRLVRLEGEGYFEVESDKRRPFVVQAGRVNTMVLGTSFNIEHTRTDQSVRVSLLKGKVKVLHQNEQQGGVVLSPGDMAVASDSAREILAGRSEVADAAAWIRGDLVMNNIPLDDALNKLAAYYSIHIDVDPQAIKGKMITAVYKRNQPWLQVLRHLTLISQLNFQQKPNGTISIAKN